MAAICELCEAARITPWYYEDDLCWIAECEACFVPMVVWRVHDAAPPDEIKDQLRDRLATVAGPLLGDDWYLDDNLRSIPDHYHAHARRRLRW